MISYRTEQISIIHFGLQFFDRQLDKYLVNQGCCLSSYSSWESYTGGEIVFQVNGQVVSNCVDFMLQEVYVEISSNNTCFIFICVFQDFLILFIKVRRVSIRMSIDTPQNNSLVGVSFQFDPYAFYFTLITLVISAGKKLIVVY